MYTTSTSSRLRSPPISSTFSTPNRAAAASAAGRWVPAMPTSLTPDTWVKCWSANSPNPPQPFTPNRMRPSFMDVDLVDVGTSGDSLSRVRHADEEQFLEAAQGCADRLPLEDLIREGMLTPSSPPAEGLSSRRSVGTSPAHEKAPVSGDFQQQTIRAAPGPPSGWTGDCVGR